MLTALNAERIKWRALQLSQLPNGKGLGRDLRRLFEQAGVVEPHGPSTLTAAQADPNRFSLVIIQSFSQPGSGFTPRQRRIVARYRIEKSASQLAEMPAALINHSLIADLSSYNSPSVLSLSYVLQKPLEEMVVAELQAVAKFVVVLCDTLLQLCAPSAVLQDAPDYTYRKLPYSHAQGQGEWCVTGHDVRTDATGVLEWCANEADAKDRLAAMNQFPERFPTIKAWTHDAYLGKVPQATVAA